MIHAPLKLDFYTLFAGTTAGVILANSTLTTSSLCYRFHLSPCLATLSQLLHSNPSVFKHEYSFFHRVPAFHSQQLPDLILGLVCIDLLLGNHGQLI